MKYKDYAFLDNTIKINFPFSWTIKEKDMNRIKISFPFGPYPTLDCHFNCFDEATINSEDKIKSYLLDGAVKPNKINKLKKDVFSLEQKIQSKGENLLIFSILCILKPRSFREVKFSLAWPDNSEANNIIESIYKDILLVINKIEFKKRFTVHDEAGVLKKKLNHINLVKNIFWEKFSISFPKRWIVKENIKEKLVNVEVDKNKEFNLFFEYFEIKIDDNKKNNDTMVANFL